MKFLEKDLEEIIFESDKDELEERGLWAKGKMLRQKRIGNYGIADLITIERFREFVDFEFIGGLDITVFELKKDKIGISALLQSIGYARGIQRYLINRNFYNFRISIKLIGSELDTSGTFCFIPDLICTDNYESFGSDLQSIHFLTYSYSIDGISFKPKSGYKLTKEGFNNE